MKIFAHEDYLLRRGKKSWDLKAGQVTELPDEVGKELTGTQVGRFCDVTALFNPEAHEHTTVDGNRLGMPNVTRWSAQRIRLLRKGMHRSVSIRREYKEAMLHVRGDG